MRIFKKLYFKIVRPLLPSYFYGKIKPLIIPVVWWYTAHYKFKKIADKSIILNSIMRSGTNYFRLILTNYLKIYYEDRKNKVSYGEMNYKLFPNTFYTSLQKNKKHGEYRRPDAVIKKAGYKDFLYAHDHFFFSYINGKIIFLYRNPLDNIISRFHHFYKYRPERQNLANHPREIIHESLEEFTRQYNFMKKLSCRKNILRISYESLFLYPEPTMCIVLNWLNIPININKLREAIAYSSRKEIKKEELRTGAIHSPADYIGSYTRSGKIGQWKDYFNNDDFINICKKLQEKDININEFIIEGIGSS